MARSDVFNRERFEGQESQVQGYKKTETTLYVKVITKDFNIELNKFTLKDLFSLPPTINTNVKIYVLHCKRTPTSSREKMV